MTMTLQQVVADYLNGAHSIFAPSGSKMWLTCSGSLIANLLAEDDAGYDAVEGTVAHAIGENWLLTGDRPDELIGEERHIEEHGESFVVPITREMLDYVEDYIDWCKFLPGDHFVEERVDFSHLTPIPKQGGTADHAACSKGHLIITDLKFGKGVKIYAYRNPQAMLYAIGFIKGWDWLYGFDKVTIRICQPRLDHFDVWETSVAELFWFGEYVRERANLAWRMDAPRTPSADACQFCRAKPGCAAYVTLAEQLADESFDDLDAEKSFDAMQNSISNVDLGVFGEQQLSPVNMLDISQLVKIRQYRKAFEGWFKAIDDYLHREAMQGEKIPGMKLVEGRSRRRFNDLHWAGELLESVGVSSLELYALTTRSPAQIETVLKGHGIKKAAAVELLADVVYKPVGRQTLVMEGDNRQPEDDDEFDDVFD